jgi:hypothetical protein
VQVNGSPRTACREAAGISPVRHVPVPVGAPLEPHAADVSHYSGTLASTEADDAAGSLLLSAALVQEPDAGFPELRVEVQGAHVVTLSGEQLHRAAELLGMGITLSVLADRLELVEVLGS